MPTALGIKIAVFSRVMSVTSDSGIAICGPHTDTHMPANRETDKTDMRQ